MATEFETLISLASIIVLLFVVADYVQTEFSALTGAVTIEQEQLELTTKAGTIVVLVIIAFLALVTYKHMPKKTKVRPREKYIRIKLRQ